MLIGPPTGILAPKPIYSACRRARSASLARRRRFPHNTIQNPATPRTTRIALIAIPIFAPKERRPGAAEANVDEAGSEGLVMLTGLSEKRVPSSDTDELACCSQPAMSAVKTTKQIHKQDAQALVKHTSFSCNTYSWPYRSLSPTAGDKKYTVLEKL